MDLRNSLSSHAGLLIMKIAYNGSNPFIVKIQHLRTYCLTLALWCAVLSLSGQVGEYRSDFCAGVNGGVTMNTMNFSPTIKQSSKIGPQLGVSFRYISRCACGIELCESGLERED